MTTETRLSAVSLALDQMKLAGGPHDIDTLIDYAGKIDTWLCGENPAEVRFQDLQTELRRVSDRLYERDIADRSARYRRSDASTGWFVGIIVALSLLAIGYLIWSANNDVSERPAVTQVQP